MPRPPRPHKSQPGCEKCKELENLIKQETNTIYNLERRLRRHTLNRDRHLAALESHDVIEHDLMPPSPKQKGAKPDETPRKSQ